MTLKELRIAKGLTQRECAGYVIYRGNSQTVDGIQYVNVEEYLR